MLGHPPNVTLARQLQKGGAPRLLVNVMGHTDIKDLPASIAQRLGKVTVEWDDRWITTSQMLYSKEKRLHEQTHDA